MEDKAQIQEAIKVQGEVVRKLKAEKASREQGCLPLFSCSSRLAPDDLGLPPLFITIIYLPVGTPILLDDITPLTS
ncbi:hypothetical protein D9C73_006059 [Collichthys lucidus]|uniref:Uncharacterized protein n=1 Tax=Collichthys lucidus TaxID=240159 RepID=A0A4U5UD98_COLLU|nr:hypothetical protein D9C73_006054 [Collichthys lucidus]TKS71986.1 hypothetical protein D9C73_006059 [Collichthys lucidus]